MEAIVVGRGIIGLAVATSLADAGVDVRLVGAPAGAGAASLAAGAMLGAYGEVTADAASVADRHEQEARARAQSRYGSWIARLGESSGVELGVRRGTFVVANPLGRRDVENLRAIERAAHGAGAPCERVSASDVPWLHPAPDAPVLDALHLAGEGWVDAPALLAALEQAVARSTRIVTHDAHVSSLLRAHDRCGGVATHDGDRLEAPMTVLCAGLWCDALLEGLLGAERPCIVGGKGSSITFAPTDPDGGPRHVVRTPNREFACGVHVVPRADGAWYLGATNRTSVTPGTSGGPTGGELHALLHAGIHELNTTIRTSPVAQVRHGYRPLVTDGYPLVGGIGDGLAIATGTYRNGILLAPLVGEWIAQLATAGEEAADNPFAPCAREQLLQGTGEAGSQVIESGARELLAFVLNPHGGLPYDRERELSNVLVRLTRAVTEDDAASRALRTELRGMVEAFPRPEVMADLYYRLAEGP